ncbi:MAG: DUF3343 domain-containing protein [Deltaproteobacteria bacterium]|nr:DUF3343 domain-containing protein [Deltaproteobacteria bacterium]
MFSSGVTISIIIDRFIPQYILGGVPLGRSSPPELILIFRGTHQVMLAEKHLKKRGVAMRLIPVPRRLTSDCGLAIRISPVEQTRARDVLSAAGLLPVSAHILRSDGKYETILF